MAQPWGIHSLKPPIRYPILQFYADGGFQYHTGPFGECCSLSASVHTSKATCQPLCPICQLLSPGQLNRQVWEVVSIEGFGHFLNDVNEPLLAQ